MGGARGRACWKSLWALVHSSRCSPSRSPDCSCASAEKSSTWFVVNCSMEDASSADHRKSAAAAMMPCVAGCMRSRRRGRYMAARRAATEARAVGAGRRLEGLC